MNESTIQVTSADAAAATEDRFHRLRLIRWWDQHRLHEAKVVVIGAGALGNELVKNLALLGVGNLFIADMDRIENSNLSRSVLYRAADNGQFKAQTAASAARDIYPDLRAQHFNGNVVYDLGLGVYRWADIVLGGLDNREARLAINRACWKVNKPWIDGAIEQISGVVRLFVPDGACYECTMSEMDWKLLQLRRSCNLLSRAQMEQGKTPTTPTVSSIIAGLQAQEAVKHLHNLSTMAGKGWVYDGMSNEAYMVEYPRKEECYSHDTMEEVVELSGGAGDFTVADLLDEARHHLGGNAVLELGREMLEKLVCAKCGREEQVFASLGKVSADRAICPHCGHLQRDVRTFFRIEGHEPFMNRTLADIGVPPFDIILARSGDRLIGLELSGDAGAVLGPLSSQEGVEWS
ncbi:MAG: ThiF family adenylyltransferase [Phycisphaeraceae bacterium]|nr:ThiF family adenylyltransferase [Phycisphaeraceae bacterium]